MQCNELQKLGRLLPLAYFDAAYDFLLQDIPLA